MSLGEKPWVIVGHFLPLMIPPALWAKVIVSTLRSSAKVCFNSTWIYDYWLNAASRQREHTFATLTVVLCSQDTPWAVRTSWCGVDKALLMM